MYLQIPIYWVKPSIPHSSMKEHPDIVKFCRFPAYVRTHSTGILMGLAPWHTDFGTKSSVLHIVRGVQAPGTHVRSDYPQTRHIGGRSSSHKATLIPQNKRQDTIAHDDTLPLLVLAYRSAYSLRRTSCKQKTYPNPFSYRIGFEYELFGGELGTRTPDPLRVMQVL